MRYLCRFMFLYFLMTTLEAGTFPDANGKSLQGVTEFDAKVIFEFNDEEKILSKENTQERFELALRRDGVVVSEAAPNYLLCRLSIDINEGLVTYVIRVEYWDYSIGDELNKLLWEDPAMGTIGSANYTTDWVAQKCADEFAKEWLKYNPRQ
jgi:hypothetical protein